ncbi:MAG: hypothetical protein WEA04_02310 [Candidatus Andersenbacteria bacterium]
MQNIDRDKALCQYKRVVSNFIAGSLKKDINVTTQFKRVWIRIAGNSNRIKANLPAPHWRYEIEGQSGQHLITGWNLLGEATSDNNTQGVNPTAQGVEFGAWVKYFGDIEIDDKQHATITLRPVPKST